MGSWKWLRPKSRVSCKIYLCARSGASAKKTSGELQRFSRPDLVDLFGKFGSELFDLCRGIDDRPVEPDRPRKSLSTEETFPTDLETLEQCEERLGELFQELMADLAQKETSRRVTKIFVK